MTLERLIGGVLSRRGFAMPFPLSISRVEENGWSQAQQVLMLEPMHGMHISIAT